MPAYLTVRCGRATNQALPVGTESGVRVYDLRRLFDRAVMVTPLIRRVLSFLSVSEESHTPSNIVLDLR